MSGELPESKQTQNLGSSPVNLQLSPNFGHICGWSLRRATAMLHTQGRNTLHHFTSMDMLKRSHFIISATKVGRLQQMWWRHLQKAKLSLQYKTGSTWWETAHVIPDRRQQTDTVSQPEHKGITVRTSAWAGPKQITGGETLALASSSYKTNKWTQTHLLQINILKHIHTLKVFRSSLYDRKKRSCRTWVNVAVTHRMDGVLALSIVLAEEGLSQTVCFEKWSRIRGITKIHHLIDCKEGLVTSLLPLSEFLRYNRNSALLMFT